MVKYDLEYKEDQSEVESINNTLKFESLDDYDLNEYYEFDSSLSIETNLMRKYVLKKRARDLKAEKEYDLAINHLIRLLDNSYFSNDYYPYRHLVINYERNSNYRKMTKIIKKFLKSGIYAHQRHVDWFMYKLLFLEKLNLISESEVDSLLQYYDSHGALNKSQEHEPIYIADRIFQRKNGEVKLDDQWHYEKQEEKYALKEKGGFLERNGLYDEAIEHYSEIINKNSNGAIEGYKRLAYIYEKLNMYEEELEIIKLFYKKKYNSVGKYTKKEFEKRTRNLNMALGTSYSIEDFTSGNIKVNSEKKNNSYSNKSNDELLFKYAELLEKGLITREEFDMKKKELL